MQFVDAVLELDVTPQITADGTIYMDVTVTNDQIDQAIPRVQGIPAIDTQAAETKVTVNDGATVVIGGIIVTQQQTDDCSRCRCSAACRCSATCSSTRRLARRLRNCCSS